MSFLKSEIVQGEVRNINKLQNKIAKGIYKFPKMTREEKFDHIDLLYELLDKQQILYTRLSLSDDPDAFEIKKNIEKYSQMLGFIGEDMRAVFRTMKDSLEDLRESI